MTRALCLFPLDQAARTRLELAWPEGLEFADGNTQERVNALDDPALEVLFADFVPSDRQRLPRLRWVQYSGAGIDALAETSPWLDGLQFTTASGVNAVPIGQYVITAVLVASGRWRERIRASSKRVWDASQEVVGESVRNKTIGIVGYGSIGREVGRLAGALGMRVVVAKRRPEFKRDVGYVVPGTGDPDGQIPSCWLGPQQLHELAEQSDFVCVTVPLTAETRNLINTSFFNHMSSTAWLINVSRGAVIDESALSTALDKNTIRGAILDVATQEPLLPNDPLWENDGVLITPHISGLVPDPWAPLVDLFEENLLRYASGRELLNVVDPQSGY